MDIQEIGKAIYIINKEAKRNRDYRESYERKKKILEDKGKKMPFLKEKFEEDLMVCQSHIDGRREEEKKYYNLKKEAIEKLVNENKVELVGKQKQILNKKEKWHRVYDVGGYSLHQPIKNGEPHGNLSEVDDSPLTKKIKSTKFNSNQVQNAEETIRDYLDEK